MFKSFKEKLKSWTKNISKNQEEKEEVIEEIAKEEEVKKLKKEIIEKVKEKIKEPDKKGKKEKEKSKEKTEKETKEEPQKKEDQTPLEKKEPEETLPDIKEDKKGFFKKVASKITKIKITEKEFENYADELELLLLENNVALEVAEKIIKELKEKIVGQELLKKEIEEEIKDCFKEIINEILIEPFSIPERIREKRETEKKPYVILFCGINGTGKTTTIAKIAEQLKKEKLTCVMAAADTFRAASIEQLKTHGNKLDVKVIAHEYNSDPAAVGFDAIKFAEKNRIDCVLIDTAGRMYTEKNLMHQIEKVAKVCKPDCKIFVGESLTGNDAIEQVRSFDWAIGIDGIILSKADIDEKGGTALSVGFVTKKPILYLGTGQEYNTIEVFDKKKFIERLGL
ncbi:MAG: signal recognition particle-docking protein FtsY [Candidatus Pacearchaeota archaeon]|jgi:fused signal recognition particle receptor